MKNFIFLTVGLPFLLVGFIYAFVRECFELGKSIYAFYAKP